MDKNDHLAIGLYSCDRLLHALITAPIPHQSVVEIHKSALRYVREKLQKYYEFRVLLEQMEIYRDVETGQYPTIPNFIFSKISFISNGFLVFGMSCRTNSAPIFLDRTILCGDPGGFKLADGACHRIVGDVDISIHSCFDALVS